MDLKKNKIFVYFFVIILFISSIFYFKNNSIIQKYINKLDFINYKKAIDYLGKKYSKIFSQHNIHNSYGHLNSYKLMDKNLNKQEISFITHNYQNYFSDIKDSNIKNTLSWKIFNIQSQLKNSEFSLQTLNYLNEYPWNNISKLFKNNLDSAINQQNKFNFLCLNNNISFD
ncbi:hypothetical protein [Buchnera aphidicola]|uniref:hypothetical protein n=1 Tax=Buchnera aphidicola TaxID=9 RepID=UPI0022385D88|nr:hypothetical protein [Buchnera aphidicola]MCW5197423.1 hypothetical protein [Buchnera aphidicola (Chaitophorus viminalis)]